MKRKWRPDPWLPDYLQEPPEPNYISNCCGEGMPNHPDSDICPKCGEHCQAEVEPEEEAYECSMCHKSNCSC